MSDLISRADAREAVKETLSGNVYWDYVCDAVDALSALPSADAEPTVIRAKTLMRKEDFDKWAEDIKKQGENVICIPCDAEVVSADAVQRWIPFTRRPMTEEEQKDYPNCTFIFDCVLPDDGDEILVSNGRFVWMDTFCNDIDGCYLDSGDDIDEDMAWMPKPKPYKGGDTE